MLLCNKASAGEFMRHHLFVLPVLPVLTVAVLFAGCAPTTPPATVITTPPPAAPAPAAPAPRAPVPAAPAPAAPAPAAPSQVSASPDELPPGVGREAVLKGCGGCHGIGQVITERRSRQEWADTTTMMITNGAPVSEAEFDLVVNYLATHFGPR
jgi:mono/diheme cytochrome c family protein